MFYETTDGFNFRSFESLMALNGATARPVKEAYAIQPAKVRNEKGDANVYKIYNHQIVIHLKMLQIH